MRPLEGHTKSVRAVAFALDGRLVSGGEDRTVRVWDTHSGRAVEVLKAKRVVYAVAVSPDGEWLAYAGRSTSSGENLGLIRTTNLRSGDDEPTGHSWPMNPPGGSVWSLSYSSDGNYLASAWRRLGGGNFLNGAGGHLWQYRAPFGAIPLFANTFAVRFSPTGTALAVTHCRAVSVFTAATSTEFRQYVVPVDWVPAVCFVPNGTTLLAAASQFLYVADYTRDAKFKKVKTGIPRVKSIAMSPDGKSLVVGGRPGRVEVYQLPDFTLRAAYDFALGDVDAIAVAPDGLTYAVGGQNGLLLCDLE